MGLLGAYYNILRLFILRPLCLSPKKDGKLRQVHDYRCLNNIAIPNNNPMPIMQDVIDSLQGCKYFSSMDCESAYHQVLLDPSDIPKTAFITPWGLFEFKVLVFGLCNSPAAFVAVRQRDQFQCAHWRPPAGPSLQPGH